MIDSASALVSSGGGLSVTIGSASTLGKRHATDLKDSDTEIGADDGCGSCYSSSMRDLLSDELPEDCTFNGNDELQVSILNFQDISFCKHEI